MTGVGGALILGLVVGFLFGWNVSRWWTFVLLGRIEAWLLRGRARSYRTRRRRR